MDAPLQSFCQSSSFNITVSTILRLGIYGRIFVFGGSFSVSLETQYICPLLFIYYQTAANRPYFFFILSSFSPIGLAIIRRKITFDTAYSTVTGSADITAAE